MFDSMRARRVPLALAIAAVVVALTGCDAVQHFTGARARSRAAVERFHTLVAAGAFQSVYEAGHPALRQTLSGEEAARRLSEVRAKLGRVVEMNDVCVDFAVDASGEETIRFEYEVSYTGGKAWETYDWRYDGEAEPKMLAYAVEIGLEDGKADWEVALAPPGVREDPPRRVGRAAWVTGSGRRS
jgi:hypothetical protein